MLVKQQICYTRGSCG
ncbi:hypothetical protein GQ600_19768 [Phytophthora cactorum]|nr:hypothetical protein GQ600_19768 [Phytophthora cactorum]